MEGSLDMKTTVVSHKKQATFKGKAVRKDSSSKGTGEEPEEIMTFGTYVYFPVINFK